MSKNVLDTFNWFSKNIFFQMMPIILILFQLKSSGSACHVIFFFCFRGLYEIKKTCLVTFNTNFQLNRLDKNLQKTCDLSLTFNACQKYLTDRLSMRNMKGQVQGIIDFGFQTFLFIVKF